MARSPGFLEAQIYRYLGAPGQYLIVRTWRNPETHQEYRATPEAKKFGGWIIDAPASTQTQTAPPPQPAPEPQVQQTSSGGNAKQQSLEEYEKEYLVRLEQQKVEAAANAAAEAAAAASASTQASKGSMPKGWKP